MALPSTRPMAKLDLQELYILDLEASNYRRNQTFTLSMFPSAASKNHTFGYTGSNMQKTCPPLRTLIVLQETCPTLRTLIVLQYLC